MVLTVNESSWDDQGVEFSWCHKIRTVFLFVVKGRLFCSRARISATGGAPPGAVVAPELTIGFELLSDNPCMTLVRTMVGPNRGLVTSRGFGT